MKDKNDDSGNGIAQAYASRRNFLRRGGVGTIAALAASGGIAHADEPAPKSSLECTNDPNARQDDEDDQPWGTRLYSPVSDTPEINSMIYRLQINFDAFGTTKKDKRGKPQTAKAKVKAKVYETKAQAGAPYGRVGTTVVASTAETTIKFKADRNGKKIKLTQDTQPSAPTNVNINSGPLSGKSIAWGPTTDVPTGGREGGEYTSMSGKVLAWAKLVQAPSITTEFTMTLQNPIIPVALKVKTPANATELASTSIPWGTWDWDIIEE